MQERPRRRRRRIQALILQQEAQSTPESANPAAPAPQDTQEIRLEPVSADVSRGKAERFRKRTDRGRRRKKLMWWLAIVLLSGVALFSLVQLGGIVTRSIRTKLLQAELSRMRVQTPNEAEITAEQAETTTEQTTTAEAAAATPSGAAQANAQALPVVKNTKYRQISGTPLPHMAKLYEQNRDLVAWIEIPDVLDQPVVFRDNSYYLTRNFYKQKSASGTIFLDENHPFRERTQNLLLHGHNMKDGTMFGHLARYLSGADYIRNHPFISFDTLWEQEQYVIFAVLRVSLDVKNESFFNYFTYDRFDTDEQFDTYIRQLQLRSEYAIPLNVEPSDALLTLSTCLDEDRLVIVARRLRKGETRSELRGIIRTVTTQ